MKIEVLNIGNELLIGQVVNTNASWLGEELNLAGFMVNRIVVIADDGDEIISALSEATLRADVVLISGGLGPTKDDITKDALCRFFNTRLIFNKEAYENIEGFFRQRNLAVSVINRKQAEIPESCIPIQNRHGTAPGMWFEIERPGSTGKVKIVSMPGVPFEMKAMVTDSVIPWLKKVFPSHAVVHKTIMTQGIGESFLSDIIEEWENQLPSSISLAYLPQPGIVRLRMTASGSDGKELKTLINRETEKLLAIIPEYVYGFDDEKLEDIIGKLLIRDNSTISTAESCTGGYIAHLLTTIPGSSSYFRGSVVAYANDIKESELNVRPETLTRYGAVSEEVVLEMAAGIRTKFKTRYSIATSGIAGPAGGTVEKPVGTTWIAIATPEKIFAKKYLFGDNRERNIRRTALQALNLLRKEIIRASK